MSVKFFQFKKNLFITILLLVIFVLPNNALAENLLTVGSANSNLTGTDSAIFSNIGSISATTTSLIRLQKNGVDLFKVDSTGNVTMGNFLTSISAANVSSGAFGSLSGNGNFSFPASLGIGVAVPVYPLHISSSSADTGLLLQNNTTTLNNSASLRFLVSTSASPSNEGARLIFTRTDSPAAADGDLSFWTRGSGVPTERMRITSNGNVGLGITNPSSKLHVIGDIRTPNNSKWDFWTGGPTSDGYIQGGGNGFVFNSYSATNGFNFTKGSSATSLMFINSSGNVGIGTTTPSAKLTVAGGNIFITDAVITSSTPHAAITKTYLDSALETLSSSTNALNYWAANGTNIYNKNTGNVGIGTTAPNSKLHVRNLAAGVSNLMQLEYGTSNNDGANINYTAVNTIIGQIQHKRIGAGDYNLAFSNWNGSALAERMTIKSNGNVGIGTTTPNAALDIFGKAKITNNGIIYNTDSSRWLDMTGANADSLRVSGNLITTDGKVGIGTTNPGSYKLNVVGNTYINGTLTAKSITDVKRAINSVSSNIGTPTVEEMALFHGQFNNKFRFFPATLQEESTDGSNWTTSTRLSANQLADLMLGEGQTTSATAIPAPAIGGSGYYRLTWDAPSYMLLNAFYAYNSTNGNQVNFKIEAYHNTNGWTEITNGTISNWPGHTYIPHNTIYFNPTNPTQSGKVRVTFSITSATYANAFTLYGIEWFGGYPAGKRNVESYDRDRNVTFPAAIKGGSGSASVPIFSFSADTDSGMYRGGENILRFSTGGADRLTIFSNGSVGIGTTTPDAKLNVNGNFHVSGAFSSVVFDKLADVSGSRIVMADSSGALYATSTSVATGLPSPSGISGQTLRSNGTSWVANNLLYNNGTNVGIGTTNPGAKLSVSGNIQSNGGSFYAYGTDTGSTPTTGSWARYYYSNALGARMFAYNSDTSQYLDLNFGLVNSFVIKGSGNVGIGTNNPSTVLHTKGYAEIDALGSATFFEGARARFMYGASPTSDAKVAFGSGWGTIDDFVIYTKTSGNFTTNSQRLTVKMDGNVGIGTTTPNQKLEVSGGNIFITDASINSGTPHAAITKTYLDSALETYGSKWILNDSKLYASSTDWNVGIGVTSPTRKLQIDTNGAGLYVAGAGESPYSQNIAEFYYKGNGNSLLIKQIQGQASITTGGSSQNLYLSTNGANSQLAINATTGNVGIGTNNPGARLETFGQDVSFYSGAGTQNLNVGRNATEKVNIFVQDQYGYFNYVQDESDTSSHNFEFNIQSASTGSADWIFKSRGLETIRFKSGGNVGIGTTTPNQKLEVSGGNIFITDASINSGTPHAAITKTYLDSALETYGSKWILNGSKLYASSTDWNVGIGTTNPVKALQVLNTGTQLRLGYDATHYYDVYLDSGGSVNHSPTSGINYFVASGLNSTLYVYDYTDGTNSYAINSGKGYSLKKQGTTTVSIPNNGSAYFNQGNVGISSTTPSGLLAIGNYFSISNLGTIYGPTTDRYLDLYGAQTNSIVVPKSILTSGGKLGVGTTAPGGKAEIAQGMSDYGTSFTEPHLKLKALNTVDNTGFVGITYDASTSANYGWSSGALRSTNGQSSFVWKYHNNSAAGVEYMRIASNGSLVVDKLKGTGNRIVLADSTGSLYATSTSNVFAFSSSTPLNMNGGDIRNVNKLTVGTIDPLYRINGTNYSSFASAIVGGVKEEYLGRAKISQARGKEYEYRIDFTKLSAPNELWVWRQTVDFSPENVEVSLTPYGAFANIYYIIEDEAIVLRADRPATVSYRLVGKRIDWQNWPTRAKDQQEKPSFIINNGKVIK